MAFAGKNPVSGSRETVGVRAKTGGQIENGTRLLSEGTDERISTATTLNPVGWEVSPDTCSIGFTGWAQFESTLALDQREGGVVGLGNDLDRELHKELSKARRVAGHDSRALADGLSGRFSGRFPGRPAERTRHRM